MLRRSIMLIGNPNISPELQRSDIVSKLYCAPPERAWDLRNNSINISLLWSEKWFEIFSHIQQIGPFVMRVSYHLRACLPKAGPTSTIPLLLLPLLRSGPLHNRHGTTVEENGGTVEIGASNIGVRVYPRPVAIVVKIFATEKACDVGDVVVVG